MSSLPGATTFALCLTLIAPPARDGATDDEGLGVAHQLPPATDAFFATQFYTSTNLLHLRSDGTFAQYDREHMFIAISDEGRWRQTASGSIELCSHYRFEVIRQGGLSVFVSAEDSAGLLPLAVAIEGRLSAAQGTKDLAPGKLMPVVVRSWRSEDLFESLPDGGLAPQVMSDEERVSRKDLHALAGAVREYAASRRGNLSTFVPRRYGDLVWLSDDGQALGKEIVQQYREHKEGPFLPGMTTVLVGRDTFDSLLGTRQSFMHYTVMNTVIPRRALIDDFRKTRIAEPQCAGFEAGAAAIPSVPTAAATAVAGGEDIVFASEEATGATLLVLGSDGRFRSYARSENESKWTDAGEWIHGADGLIRLCSHSSVFRPIAGERLHLEVDQATYSKLPALLSALQRQLRANPAKQSFSPKTIERLAARALDAKRPGTEDCSCQMLVYGDEDVAREALQEFVDELDRYLRSGAANLREQRLFSLGSTSWLGDPDGRSNRSVVQTLRAFGGGPCILPGVPMQVPMQALQGLGGAPPKDEVPQGAGGKPLCAGFLEGARR